MQNKLVCKKGRRNEAIFKNNYFVTIARKVIKNFYNKYVPFLIRYFVLPRNKCNIFTLELIFLYNVVLIVVKI